MILVVGLSPAWQRTLVFDSVRLGAVNRARYVRETASGKGVNVARVAHQLGAPARLLRDQALPATVIKVRAETRICQTLLGGGAVTELVEEAGALTRSEVAEVVSCFEAEIRRASVVVMTGSVPPGCGEDFYARLMAKANRAGVPVLIDAQGRQLYKATAGAPLVVKINRDELRVVPGLRRKRVGWLVVSDGAKQVAARHGVEKFVFRPPRVRSLNSVGSGDAMMAGIACGVWRGQAMLDAIKLGIACGAANALTAAPGDIRLTDVRRLLKRI
jgi:tagatose 6-phosphate kinase